MKSFGLTLSSEVVKLSSLLDVFLMKQRALDVDDRNARTVYWIMLEKVSIIICLTIVFTATIAMKLNWWLVGLVVGLSLGPIVYVHYYLIYIRPVLKQRED